MNNKQKVALIFMGVQRKIGNVFVENEHEINDEVSELLTEITMKLDEAMELIAEIEELEE